MRSTSGRVVTEQDVVLVYGHTNFPISPQIATDAQKFTSLTHDSAEAPEKCSIGKVQTGWHTVDLRVASVSAYLPSVEDNNAPFLGTTADGRYLNAPTLTPKEEAALRLQQLDVQRQDAAERRVVWDAEEGPGDVDAEGEDDDGMWFLGLEVSWTEC